LEYHTLSILQLQATKSRREEESRGGNRGVLTLAIELGGFGGTRRERIEVEGGRPVLCNEITSRTRSWRIAREIGGVKEVLILIRR
jgi:hypothetical protein